MTECAEATVAGGNAAPRQRLVAHWLHLLRIPHWVKNAIVFPAVVLAGRAGEAGIWSQAAWVFAAFCLASSGVYALNDVFDRDADRQHPLKRQRPVAAGYLAPRAVLVAATALSAAGLALAWQAGLTAMGCLAAYLVLNAAYSLSLKHIPIVDAGAVAAGFVLRVVAVTGVPGPRPGDWLLAASIFSLCFCVAVSKRAADLTLMRQERLENGALRLADGYTYRRIRGLLAASAVATVLCYAGFARLASGPGEAAAQLSCLPVAFCLFRLSRLSLAGQCRDQVDLVRRDVPLIVAAAAWAGLWIWVVAH